MQGDLDQPPIVVRADRPRLWRMLFFCFALLAAGLGILAERASGTVRGAMADPRVA